MNMSTASNYHSAEMIKELQEIRGQAARKASSSRNDLSNASVQEANIKKSIIPEG